MACAVLRNAQGLRRSDDSGRLRCRFIGDGLSGKCRGSSPCPVPPTAGIDGMRAILTGSPETAATVVLAKPGDASVGAGSGYVTWAVWHPGLSSPPMWNEGAMSYYLDHRGEAALLLLGGATTAISIALARQAKYVLAMVAAVVALTVLFAAGKVMLRESADWGSVVLGAGDRRNALLAAIGFVAVGIVVMWLGSGPIPALSKVGLVAGGCVLFLCGVVALTIWLYARSYMAGSDGTG